MAKCFHLELNMSNSLNLAKISAKGGFNLFLGLAISSTISAIGMMIVAGILSEADYGIYAIALIAPSLMQLLSDFGIDQATIKYTAEYNHENEPNKIRNILAAAITLEILFGFIFSIAI